MLIKWLFYFCCLSASYPWWTRLVAFRVPFIIIRTSFSDASVNFGKGSESHSPFLVSCVVELVIAECLRPLQPIRTSFFTMLALVWSSGRFQPQTDLISCYSYPPPSCSTPQEKGRSYRCLLLVADIAQVPGFGLVSSMASFPAWNRIISILMGVGIQSIASLFSSPSSKFPVVSKRSKASPVWCSLYPGLAE